MIIASPEERECKNNYREDRRENQAGLSAPYCSIEEKANVPKKSINSLTRIGWQAAGFGLFT
jgi:hypothetical protein